ncbi:hypothetical protein DXG01_007595 [Tephrocybe rancida]|nr:hypothetical protein DXG01_007595 [Tephrocybe rancida]
MPTIYAVINENPRSHEPVQTLAPLLIGCLSASLAKLFFHVSKFQRSQSLLIRDRVHAIYRVPLQRLQRLSMDKVGVFHCTQYVAADSEDLRILVCILFFMDTMVTLGVTFATRGNYYGQANVLDPLWAYSAVVFIHSSTSFIVHLFLTHRIYRLTDGKRILSKFTLLLIMAGLGLGIETTVKMTGLGTLAKAQSIKNMLTIWLSFGFTIDFYIAITLIVLLLKSRTGFQRSNSVIHRLVGAAIQTAIFAGTALILFLKYPMSRYYVILGLAAGRVYSASVMDTLLVRHSLREEIKGGRTPTSALRQLEDLEELGWLPGAATSAKGPAELQLPVLARIE